MNLHAWLLDSLEATARGEEGVLVVERAAPHAAMPPLHVRDRDESFHVLAGEVEFFVGDEAVSARPGDVVVAPAGAVRTFRVRSAEARWLVSTRVACAASYEHFARATSADWRRLRRPSEEEDAGLAAVARANGIRVLGPPGLLPEDVSPPA